MADDAYEMRIKSFATVCPKCFRLSQQHRCRPGGGLPRDGWMHAYPADRDDDVPLCELWSDWVAVIREGGDGG